MIKKILILIFISQILLACGFTPTYKVLNSIKNIDVRYEIDPNNSYEARRVLNTLVQNVNKDKVKFITKVNIKEKKIEAYGINFPVLIHELSKGVIDYITTAGVPNEEDDGVTPEELKYIYGEADNYAHEQWHYFFGPTLWRAMLETADVGSNQLIPIIRKMSEMTYEELSEFCNNIVFYPEEFGVEEMSKIK